MTQALRFLIDSVRKAYERGVLDLATSMVLVMALGFLQNTVLARVLGAEGLGHMAVIYSVMGIAGLLGSAGVTSSILRYGAAATNPSAAWGIYRRGLRIVATASVISAGVLALFARSRGWVFDPVAGAWMPFVAVVVPAQALASSSLHFLQARTRMRDKAVLELLGRFLIVSCAVTGALLDGFEGCVVGYVIGNAASSVVSLVRTRVLRAVDGSPPAVSGRELARFGAWGVLVNALGMVMITADVLAMSALTGDAKAVGIYSLASLFQQVASIASRAYLDARFPEMTRAAAVPGQLRAMRGPMRLHLLGLVVAPALPLALIAPWLLPTVFGPDFAGSVHPLWILLLGQVVSSLGAAQGRSIFAAGWVEGNFWASSLAALFNVVALLVLVPRFHAVGAATAAALTQVVFATTVTIMCRRMEARQARG